MIEIAPGISVDDSEIREEFVRSSGPGGQHVNKSSTAVQLRFNVLDSPSLPEAVRAQLVRKLGTRITAEGDLVITAQEHRSQVRNREEALARLRAIIDEATRVPKKRKKTRPTRASQQARIQEKKKRGEKKSRRGPIRPGDY